MGRKGRRSSKAANREREAAEAASNARGRHYLRDAMRLVPSLLREVLTDEVLAQVAAGATGEMEAAVRRPRTVAVVPLLKSVAAAALTLLT